MRFRTISPRAIVRRFAGVLAGASIVLAGAVAQDGAAARIRELADRGRAERDRGEIDASIDTFELAQDIAEAADDLRSVINLDSEIANSLSQAGRYERVLEILRRVEGRVEEMEDDPRFVEAVRVHVRSDVSQTLQELGRLNEALDEAEAAVRGLETIEDPAVRGSAFSALGNSLMWLGRPAEARVWLQRAVEEFESLPPQDVRRVQVGIRLSQCVGELGDSESALEHADELVNQLESLGSLPPYLGSEVYSLRGQLRFYEDWSGAEQDLRGSLELLKAAGVDKSGVPFQRTTLQLAHAIRNQGRPEESATLERQTLSVLREHHRATDLTAIQATQFLAASLRDIYDRSGKREHLDESRVLLEEAARLSKAVGNPNSASVFALLGELLLEPFDDPQAAEPWLRAAVDEIETRSSRSLMLGESERASLLERRRLNKRYDPYESLLRCLVRLERSEEALDVLEHSRARSLTDLLDRSRLDSLHQALELAEKVGDVPSAERIRRLPREIDSAMAKLAQARASTDSQESRAQVRRAHDQIRELERERAELTRSVTTIGKVASIDEVRRGLGKDEVLLAYFLGRRVSFACLAEPVGGRIEWIPLVDENGSALTSEAVEVKSRAWVGALSRGVGDPARGLTASKSTPERDASMTLTGHQLFRWLAPPTLWQHLRARTIVHMMPHGPLNWLPFEALVVEPKSEATAPVYWIDRGPAIAYHESGSALVWAQRRREEQKAETDHGLALIVADPTYRDVPEDRARTASGPVVVRVMRGGSAAREGLLVGDELESLAGTKIASVDDFEQLQRANQDTLGASLVVFRSGGERTLRLLPGDPDLELAPSFPPEWRRGPSRARLEPLERLPGTAREATAVRDALEKKAEFIGSKESLVRVLTGGEATETLLTAWASSASILHIAAHQIPDSSGWSDSGRIALTAPPFPTAEDDGYVDLDDFLLHWRGRLERCGLAVLSSCWSRAGRLMRDEGFFGLPLGLRFAGCPAIVSSLWPVDDAATADLMSSFYGSLGTTEAESRLAAFQSSKRALKSARPDPYYWAAFVWSGAPR